MFNISNGQNISVIDSHFETTETIQFILPMENMNS